MGPLAKIEAPTIVTKNIRLERFIVDSRGGEKKGEVGRGAKRWKRLFVALATGYEGDHCVAVDASGGCGCGLLIK